MATALEALHRLQDIEVALASTKQLLTDKKRSVQLHTARLVSLDEDLRARREEARRHQMEADRLDLDVKSREAEIKKLRTALNTARTNKEYAAVLTQINIDKADNAKLEDRILQLLARVDEVHADLERLRVQRDQEAQRLAQLQQEFDQLQAQLQEQIQELQAKRDEVAAEVPPTALHIFERVAEHNEGQAMALLVQPNPSRLEYICQGCNMTVTLEQVNALKSRDDIQLCHICGRILYLEAPAPERASPA